MPAALLTLPLATQNFVVVFCMLGLRSGRMLLKFLLMTPLLAPESIRKLKKFPLISVGANYEDGLEFMLTVTTLE